MAGGKLDLIDPWIVHAIEEIKRQYGVTVSVDQKRKSLLKFGGVSLATNGVQETIQSQGGFEVYQTDNLITSISSSDNLDTVELVVEGHIIDGSGNFTFVAQPITLVGQTETSLTTPLARATRLYNNDSTDLLGIVYVYRTGGTVTAGVPQVAADIHLQSAGLGQNHSLKGATTMSSTDFWLVTQLFASVDQRIAAAAAFEFQVRAQGMVFRTVVPSSSASTGANFNVQLRPYGIVPANADVRVVGTPSANNVPVSAWANGLLASIVS